MEALRSELITKFTTEVSEGVNIAFKQSDGTKSEQRFWFSANGTVEVVVHTNAHTYYYKLNNCPNQTHPSGKKCSQDFKNVGIEAISM